MESAKEDMQFMKNFTNGYEEYLKNISETPWEIITESSGISKDRILYITKIYVNSRNVIFSWAIGVTQHIHGVENVESIVNLELLRSMVGRRFA